MAKMTIYVEQYQHIFYYDNLEVGPEPAPVHGVFKAPIIAKRKLGQKWARKWFERWCERRNYEPEYVSSLSESFVIANPSVSHG